MGKLFTGVFFSLLIAANLNAQKENTFNGENKQLLKGQFWGIEEGLSHRQVNSIVQDNRDMMWLATDYGINRFDGISFKWFTTENSALQKDLVTLLKKDQQGFIWVFYSDLNKTSLKHIDILDPETEKIISLQEFLPDSIPFKFSDVSTMSLTESKEIIFITKSAIYYYEDRFYETPLNGLDIYNLRGIERSPQGDFWLSFYMLYADTSYFKVLNTKGRLLDSIGFKNSSYIDIYEWDSIGQPHLYVFYHWPEDSEPEQKYFYAKKEGGLKIDPYAEARFGPLGINNNFLRRFFTKIGGLYWVYSKNEEILAIPQSPQGEVTNLQDVSKELRNASGIYSDKQGAVWISTAYGIHRFTLDDLRFERHFYEANRHNTRSIRGIKTSGKGEEKKLWAMSEMPRHLYSKELSSKKVKIEESFAGGKWALGRTQDSALMYMTDLGLKTRSFSELEHDSLTPLAVNVSGGAWVLHQDKYGQYWFNSHFRASFFRLNKDGLLELPRWHDAEVNPYVYQIYENDSDTAWIVASKGIFSVSLKSAEILERYWSGGKGKYYLAEDNIQHLLPNKDGSFWLATAKSGLQKWSPERGRISIYNRLDGLPSNNIYAVYKDHLQNLWLSTEYGIAHIDLRSSKIRTYTKNDGLSNNEFNRLSHHKDSDGVIYFGGLNGITSFHPSDFYQEEESYEPNLIFTNLKVFRAKKDTVLDYKYEIQKGQSLIIEPGDYITEIAVSLLSYQELEKVQYAYILEGLSESWTYQASNIIQLGKLPYGNYKLDVKGQEANGRWSNKELSIDVHFIKPYYLETWFISLCVLILFLGFTLFFKVRRKAQIARQKELEKQVRERTQTIEVQKDDLLSLDRMKSRFFANISHELRTPLTLISTPLNKLIKEGESFNPKEKRWLSYMQRNTGTLLGLVNEILDLSKMEEGKLKLEVEELRLYQHFELLLEPFGSLAKEKDITFKWQINLDPRLIVKVDKVKLDKVLTNLLSNAFKFSNTGGLVEAFIRPDEGEQIIVAVVDNGIGIKDDELEKVFERFYQAKSDGGSEVVEAQGGTGLGLALSKDLIDLMNGEIWVESEWQKGSTFYFKFPYSLPAAQAEMGQESAMDQKKNLEVGNSISQEKSNKPHILVVEDNPDLQFLLKDILEDKYRISLAENGAKAWSLLNGKRGTNTSDSPSFDLVLSDQMMPIMNGLSLLNKIKEAPSLSFLPFIMLTARVESKLRMSALRIGVNDFLTKPFEEEELILRINNLLENQKARRETAAEEGQEQEQESQPHSQKLESTPLAREEPLNQAKEDQTWLAAFDEYISKNLDNSDLKVTDLAFHFAMSESTLLRQVKKLTGLSPQKYLQEARLQRALTLIEEGDFTNFSNLCQRVGFKELASFSRSFKARFGRPPSSFIV